MNMQTKRFYRIRKTTGQGLLAGLFLSATLATAQQVDLETLGKGKAFKLSGNIAASGLFRTASRGNNQNPFTYFLQGSLTVGLYQFSMPISYSYSNQGDAFNYQLPFQLNRLSLHPKYKWIQAHIGDATMNFSPYTLNSHQFTGGGIVLTPPKLDITFSAMVGRLRKAVREDDNPLTIPSFNRMGYSAKITLKKKNVEVTLIGFYANDDPTSIPAVSDEKGVQPKENLVLSIGGSYKIMKHLQFNIEYASTAITENIQSEKKGQVAGTGLAGWLFSGNSSTAYYGAVKAGLNYSIGKVNLGLGYERVDPKYNTLGAYFFNNDFENFTLQVNTTLLKGKLSLAINTGYQHDDLTKVNEDATGKIVGSINATLNATKQLSITASYSNFSLFTTTKPNQFDVIDPALQELRPTNYNQVSQNGNLSVNYVFAPNGGKEQNINVNYTLANVVNTQNEKVRIGGISTFHNLNSSYTLFFPDNTWRITPALRTTFNTIGEEEAITWGPTLSVGKKFFKKALNTSLQLAYSASENKAGTTTIINMNANASYVYKKKHTFSLRINQLIQTLASGSSDEFTLSFRYNYALGNLIK